MKTNHIPQVPPAEDNKTEHINVRVSPEVKKLVRQQARRERRTMGDWLRVRLEEILMEKN